MHLIDKYNSRRYYSCDEKAQNIEKFMLAGRELFKAASLYFKRVKKVHASKDEIRIVSLFLEKRLVNELFLVSKCLLSGRIRIRAFLQMCSIETHLEGNFTSCEIYQKTRPSILSQRVF